MGACTGFQKKRSPRLDLTTSGSCLMILWNCMETVFLETTRRLSAGLHSSVGNQSRSSHRKKGHDKRKYCEEFWNAVTGGVSKGIAPDEAGGKNFIVRFSVLSIHRGHFAVWRQKSEDRERQLQEIFMRCLRSKFQSSL